MIYANCEHFISTHGGTGTLASYFGGKNILFSKEGYEHYLGEFENIFPKLSGAQVFHVKTYKSLHSCIGEQLLEAAKETLPK